MPIYEYRCPKGHVFELFQSMSEAPTEVCTICGEGPVQKVLYPVAVHFKGSGFYTTDYGKGGKKREPSKDGASSETGKSEDKKPAETKND